MIPTIKQIFIASILFLTGCTSEVDKHNEQPLAQVKGRNLFVSDIKRELPHFEDKNDSVKAALEFINKWIKQQLLISEAESKLSREECDVSIELEKYRQELLIYKYKNKRLQHIIDQSVPEEEVVEYYNKNQDKFVLSQPVVRINYIVFPAELTIPANIRNILNSTNANDVGEYEEFIYKYARKYDNFENKWIHLDNLLKSIHISIAEPDNFLKKQKIIEKKLGNDIHIIAIKQYYLSGEQAPIDLIAPQIRGAIINKEKLDFLREIKDSLYKDALKYNKFKVFN